MGRHWKKNCGQRLPDKTAFTLMEMVIVCFLISLMLAVGIPLLRDGLLTDKLKATSRKIIGTVKGAREEAVRSRQSFYIFFDLDKKRFWYEHGGDEKNGDREHLSHGTIALPQSVRILDIQTKTAGRQTRGTVSLWISSQGYMDMTVIHMADADSTVSIFFSPFLGSVQVVDGYADFE